MLPRRSPPPDPPVHSLTNITFHLCKQARRQALKENVYQSSEYKRHTHSGALPCPHNNTNAVHPSGQSPRRHFPIPRNFSQICKPAIAMRPARLPLASSTLACERIWWTRSTSGTCTPSTYSQPESVVWRFRCVKQLKTLRPLIKFACNKVALRTALTRGRYGAERVRGR